MVQTRITALLVISVIVVSGRPVRRPSKIAEAKKQTLQTSRPYNIAHRGANGELPEETAAAYLRAIDEGADFIESDILSTKDGVMICHHDVTLDDTSEVADLPEFSDRKTSYVVQGVNMTGFFVVDFTIDELKTLRAKQRYVFRDQQYNGLFQIITFQEYISIALDADRVNDHVKWAGGKRFEEKFVEMLQKYGYKGAYMTEEWLKQPAFIQSFAPTSLVYISNLTNLPKVFLIDDVTVITEDTNQTYWEITSDSYFNYIKDYCMGIGPWKDNIVPPNSNNYLEKATDEVARAHALGMQVHPYTYRNENSFLHFDFNQDPYAEYDFWLNKVGVDGLFTDFTGNLHKYQEWFSHLNYEKCSRALHRIAFFLGLYN